jgi:hypothetical protein
MSIKTFIQNEIIAKRLQKHPVLVVYDPERRYRELCLELAGERCCVIDATESSIESREAAMHALQSFGADPAPIDRLLVVVPAAAPMTDDEKVLDPFSVYGAAGGVFPEGDGDDYYSLCLKAKPDYRGDIQRIFADNPNPDFSVIDAVGNGQNWPQLQALLRVESARDILFALLAPSDAQKVELSKKDGWASEAKELLSNTLGMGLQTRSKKWDAIRDELWRFVLFSEFTFDLPAAVALPEALRNVPRARDEARPLVEDLCERLRNDQRALSAYIEHAERVEGELALPAHCQHIDDLGVRDTFAFEERTFFVQATSALLRDDVDPLREVLGRHAQSVWVRRGDNHGKWNVLAAAARLMEACADAGGQLQARAGTQGALIDFYLSRLRDVDRRQREFEQAAGDAVDLSGDLGKAVSLARKTYRALADKTQAIFVRHLESSGWPPAGRLANADVFDKLIAPKLQESGRRVALFLIDALRYELGVELNKELGEAGASEPQAAFAALPSVTPVGMASLLPNAGPSLRLTRNGDKLQPMLGDQPVSNLSQRMEVLRRRYGQRFTAVDLKDFARSRAKLDDTVSLLVIRSNEMDALFETNPEAAFSAISKTFQQIRAALRRLGELGFEEAVIAADHGFYLNTGTEAGDVCQKPAGNWTNVHERMLLGEGNGNSGTVALPAAALGVKGEFTQVALPRAMVAYAANVQYFHGGASLQEAVVPVISVRLHAAERPASRAPKITLSYPRNSKRITTRLPVVDVSAEPSDLFTQNSTVEVLVEAHDKRGQVVGEAKVGGPVNPATRCVAVPAGETVQVTLRMNEDFEGAFTVKALDPATLTTHGKLDLETDYTV